ncbi:MAG: AMP-binding protein, partial [Opitutales bacterium]
MPDYPLVRRLLEFPLQWQDREVFRSSAEGLTFGNLRDGMLQMAGWLEAETGVRPGDRVAVCLPRGPAAVLAIYGILAAGAAYVPLQFLGPPVRLNTILASIRPRFLLTTPEMSVRLAAEGTTGRSSPVRTVVTDGSLADLRRLWQGTRARSGVAEAGPDDLAVIFFTSGSTGEPRGVMLSQRSVAATIRWVQRRDRTGEHDRLVAHAGLHYVSSFDIFYTLFSGCRVFLAGDREVLFPDRLAELIEQEEATLWLSTATALRLLLEEGDLARRRLSRLRRICIAGEAMSIASLNRLMAALPQAEYVNLYGATEASSMAQCILPRPLPESW